MSSRVIAIDGPSASGKSTVARRVADELGFLYVDSGSLYRGVTWCAMEQGVDCGDADAITALVTTMNPEFFLEEGAVRFRIGGVAPVAELRTQEVTERVSPVSAVPAVRREVVAWLRGLDSFGSLVMEGRDIGTAVFPATPFKFYLDASAEARARRRHQDADSPAEGERSVKDVRDSLQRRDRIDSTRKLDPLRVAEDAIVIDSTDLEVEQVVARVVQEIAVREEERA